MERSLYNKLIICPVCQRNIEVTVVKIAACKISSKDSDFCVYYEGVNPILYDAWVCGLCGYAARSSRFEIIKAKDSKKIMQTIGRRWVKRELTGKRDINTALSAYKLVLYNAKTIDSPGSEIASICMRIAWLFRMKKDRREVDFLNFALENYKHAYENERFPVDKLDEYTCIYIIAELNRRTGQLKESLKWFSMLISSPSALRNKNLINLARDQYYMVKEQWQAANK